MPTPFKREEIPYTQSRLKSLIKIYTTFGGYQPDPNNPTAIPNLAGLELVGSVSKIDISEPRGAQERRELNYDTAGQIQEMVPGLAVFTVKLSHVVLYRQTILEALGFAGHELRFQTRPVLLALKLPSPTPETLPEKTLLLRDCWLKDNPLNFSVEEKDDLRIIQEVELACAGILEVLGS